MRTIFAVITMMLLIAPATAGMNTLYTSSTTLGGLCLDNDTLYFGEGASVTAMSLTDLTTTVAGSVPASIKNTFVAVQDGTLYSVHDTSFSAPFPSAFGSFDGVGAFSSLVTLIPLLLLSLRPAQGPFFAMWAFAVVGLFGFNYPLRMSHCRTFLAPAYLGRGMALLTALSFIGVALLQSLSG